MWRTILSAAILFGLSSLPVVVGLAVASDEQVCRAPLATTSTMSAAEARRIGEQLGYVITKVHVDDGCYELKGSDRNGAEVELTLDPNTGTVLPARGTNSQGTN